MYKHQEYPKWIKNNDNVDIIVQNKEEELENTKKTKKEANHESDKNNSKRVNKKVNDSDGSIGAGRESI